MEHVATADDREQVYSGYLHLNKPNDNKPTSPANPHRYAIKVSQAVAMRADGVPQAPFVVRDFDRLDEERNFGEGEGDSDGEAACRFTVTRSTAPNMAVDNVIARDLCDIVINALGIPLGGSGRGELTWHLARCRDASNTSQFRSVPIEVTVAVDGEGNLIAVDGVPVQAEPAP